MDQWEEATIIVRRVGMFNYFCAQVTSPKGSRVIEEPTNTKLMNFFEKNYPNPTKRNSRAYFAMKEELLRQGYEPHTKSQAWFNDTYRKKV